MAAASDLPCDGDGICMVCKAKPSNEESLTCNTCATPWHVTCLSSRPETMADALKWVCPDCSSLSKPNPVAHHHSSDLVAAIRAIESDTSLTEREKAKRRQRLMCKRDEAGPSSEPDADAQGGPSNPNDLLDLLGGNLNCSICMQLPERPITTPCGHNFCLKCFQKWTGQGKRSCANCRRSIPSRVASNPRINSALVVAIRMAKASKSNADVGQAKTYHFVRNQNRPDKAFTTERAKKSGKANACCGKIFVTSAPDHFGPILAENDPERNQGVLVGESWEDRMECRQWGIHLPHVAGIAGQSSYGSQSVALSGGYEDDEDHGEWFLYTGSGGRDLSGNKRTNKNHSFDQKFEKSNEALRVSCRKGYPVRVVRSHKEKRSAYAPETGVRYDGIYRIEKCWRKKGGQGYIVCRYLFVRCDNEPAPWTSNDHGDLPRPLPVIPELKKAMDLTERKESPSWDYDEETGRWMWKKPPPPSRKRVHDDYSGNGKERRRSNKAHKMSARERLLKEFSCYICRKVMTLPLTTPCAHNFCKACLESAFAGQSAVRQRTCQGRRTLRSQKNIMKCPCCSNDIAEFLQNPQVNRELMSVIESLKHKDVESEENEESNSVEDTHEEGDINDEDEEDDEDDEEEEGEENCYEEGEEKENTLKPETDVNLQETGKQKKATSGSPLTDVKTSSLEQLNAPNNEKTDSQVKPGSAEVEEPQAPPKESKVKTQNQKRKKAEDGGNVAPLGVGATIRSKRAKTAAAK
ncbi:Cdk-activating kinase assembly factor [Parasponia andersonii]|uniref:RING-type E3 ubiquitin transferase n=1 Tax=Parasponia andersonii TaxID=3476 RepID=A0A2P5AM51_PARAD|nr:Cdk-activating kinase assembly factor [Parasponia andersonii]